MTQKKKVAFNKSITFKITILVVAFSLILLSSIYIVFLLFNKKELKNNSINTVLTVAQDVNTKLNQQLTKLQILAITLSNVGSTMGADHENNKKIIKNLINLQGYEHFIAGGGIWPEPFAFDKTKERSSYFFARDKDNNLKFYDDYNNPDGSGYHNEEWYVPVKYYKIGSAYWSKSYVDPYSSEPMTTISVPIRRDGVFIGVATVDIMLKGLKKFLQSNLTQIDGYGFIIDRNHKLLSYPNDKDSKIESEYITFDKLAQKHRCYSELNSVILKNSNIKLSEKYLQIAKSLDKQSVQIDFNEAKKISKLIENSYNKLKSNSTNILTIKGDSILHKKSIAINIYNPMTSWDLVIVVPNDIILSQSNRIFHNLIIVIIIIVLISTLLAYFAIRKLIIKPISSMVHQLDRDNTLLLEEVTRKDEFGLLAFWFNDKIKKNQLYVEQMLQQSRLAQMGEMISMIAHQWRQPLNAISLTANNLQLKCMLDELEPDYLEKELGLINDFSQHLSKTIDDFRNFFKANKKKETTNLKLLVESTLAIVKISLENKNIQVKTSFNCSHEISTYPSEVMQVLLNIVKNAEDILIEKGIENPSIIIDTLCAKEHSIPTIIIKDNAGGIPEEIMDKIFDPYFSTKLKKDGTGLGLYMSKIIIETHCAGKLNVSNDKDGAIFTIEL